jgi:5'(3')-deoxyribonucleotidase
MKERATAAEPVFAAANTSASPTIAVDLDDTLNSFTETLRQGRFPYNQAYGLPEAVFHRYVESIRTNAPEAGDLLSTEYSFLRYKLHAQCYRRARARADGVRFMRWLRRHHWRIVICTQRDLRRTNAGTREWLAENGIPFDYLFMALNKIVFCKAWGIRHLVDDDVFNIEHGGRYDVNVYYPIMPKHQALPPHAARGFQTFEEVRRWIQE